MNIQRQGEDHPPVETIAQRHSNIFEIFTERNVIVCGKGKSEVSAKDTSERMNIDAATESGKQTDELDLHREEIV